MKRIEWCVRESAPGPAVEFSAFAALFYILLTYKVILPCDLPHWSNLQKQLSLLSSVTNGKQLSNGMLKIYDLCNTGLDPDEPEKADPEMFLQLEIFLTSLSNDEKISFFGKILPAIIKRALNLKFLKPANGFHFSLQQQGDEIAYKRSFLASLLAHSFFSTFPKRTDKSHPTLQDFNFNYFFKYLDQPCQRVKLKSVFHYFELLENVLDDNELVTFSRQVMTGKQWLTINDWLESGSPLCPISVRNEGFLNEVTPQYFRICFSSSKIGGSVLCGGTSQESLEFCTIPELICILASVEALEDNEVFLINNACQVSKIMHPKQKAVLDKFQKPVRVNLCCMDAENYSAITANQLEEDNILRELNKALLGFRQGKSPAGKYRTNPKVIAQRRLTPIGESFSSTPCENHLSKEETERCLLSPERSSNVEIKSWLTPPEISIAIKCGTTLETRRNRFIVLGSSGECLPVNRGICPIQTDIESRTNNNGVASLTSSEDDDVFISAENSLDEGDGEIFKDAQDEKYPVCDSPYLSSSSEEDVISFTQRLREALLRGAKTYSIKTDDSSYAVDISVSGSLDEDNNIRCKRGTSTGFMLQGESLNDGLRQEVLKSDHSRDDNQSDDYSFTTDDSDLDVYDKLSKWIMTGSGKEWEECCGRKETVSNYASSLLKRALSDSCTVSDESFQDKKRAVLFARSFSLELAKQNPKLAAQLVSLLSRKDLAVKSILPNKYGQKPVATGNWGCGSRLNGDPQIKLTIQWLAASYTGLPNLIYYTCRHHKLVKLDTVRRVLLDRGWTVGQLATLLLEYADMSQKNGRSSTTLFDMLITSIHD